MATTRSEPVDVAWEAESLRATGIFPPGVTLETVPLWRTLSDQPPEQISELPQQGVRQEIGMLGHGQLIISQTTNRVDIIYAPKQAQLPSAAPAIATGVTGLPTVGAFEQALQEFVPIVHRWLNAAQSVGRLAFASVLLHRVATARDGYEILRELLLPHVKVDPEGSSEMLWQINRKRVSKVLSNKNINRLSKWSLAQLRRVEMTIENAGILPAATGTLDTAVRVEIDINTEDVRDPLPPEALVPLFDELCGLAREIAKNGDRP